jgi:DNA processing protein
MLPRDDQLAWAILARTPGLNAISLSEALEWLHHPAAIVGCSETAAVRAGLPPAARAFLSSRAALPRAAERRWLDAPQHHLVPFNHPCFPSALRALPDCPLALYVAGNIAALAEPQLAVVGSRCPTPQGRETARALSGDLSERGVSITSGLAEGIDSCAHQGALDAQGITLGILGTGIDVVYPACNRGVFADIEQYGALLSEFPIGAPPRRQNFPRRNRVIAALGLGTLVVEATQRSGSLITARLANSYGREVFAVPGSIHSPLSRGCHELIKAGAKLVESADDILSELNFSAFFTNDLALPSRPPTRDPDTSGMDKDHKILLDALGFDPADLDTLIVRTGFKPEAVSSMMLILELEGHVQAAPGGRYARVAYRRAGGER